MYQLNATFPLEKPYEASCVVPVKWKSPHKEEFVCQRGHTYRCVSEMPGYGLVGIVCDAGTVHYLPYNYFIPLSVN